MIGGFEMTGTGRIPGMIGGLVIEAGIVWQPAPGESHGCRMLPESVPKGWEAANKAKAGPPAATGGGKRSTAGPAAKTASPPSKASSNALTAASAAAAASTGIRRSRGRNRRIRNARGHRRRSGTRR